MKSFCTEASNYHRSLHNSLKHYSLNTRHQHWMFLPFIFILKEKKYTLILKAQQESIIRKFCVAIGHLRRKHPSIIVVPWLSSIRNYKLPWPPQCYLFMTRTVVLRLWLPIGAHCSSRQLSQVLAFTFSSLVTRHARWQCSKYLFSLHYLVWNTHMWSAWK